MLLLHDNTPIHTCNFVQAAIGQVGFIELNHPAYYPDIAPSDCHLFSNLKKFLRGKNFSSDDEAVITVEDYSTDLNLKSFYKGIQSLDDRWQRVVAARSSVHSINTIIVYPQFNSICPCVSLRSNCDAVTHNYEKKIVVTRSYDAKIVTTREYVTIFGNFRFQLECKSSATAWYYFVSLTTVDEQSSKKERFRLFFHIC